jgi:hypothetical protein
MDKSSASTAATTVASHGERNGNGYAPPDNEEFANPLGGAPSAQPVGGVVRDSLMTVPVLRVASEARGLKHDQRQRHGSNRKSPDTAPRGASQNIVTKFVPFSTTYAHRATRPPRPGSTIFNIWRLPLSRRLASFRKTSVRLVISACDRKQIGFVSQKERKGSGFAPPRPREPTRKLFGRRGKRTAVLWRRARFIWAAAVLRVPQVL